MTIDIAQKRTAIRIPAIGTTCMLCQKEPPIENSHILPKFAVKWLKQNSSPYLRSPARPNLREQDIDKEPLLGLQCEQRLSIWEEKFADEIFKPYHANVSDRTFAYGKWLIYFVVSVSWRVLAIQLPRLRREEPGLIEHSERAFEDWRLFLLNQSQRINPYEHRIAFFSTLDLSNAPLDRIPLNFNNYCMRAFDCSVVSTDHKNRVFSLIPGMAIWSTIYPPRSKGWPEGSNIIFKGVLSTSQQIQDLMFSEWLLQRAKSAGDAKISPEQQKKVNQTFEQLIVGKSVEDLSKMFEVHRADQRLALQKQRLSKNHLIP
jgi:hypothetical protein